MAIHISGSGGGGGAAAAVAVVGFPSTQRVDHVKIKRYTHVLVAEVAARAFCIVRASAQLCGGSTRTKQEYTRTSLKGRRTSSRVNRENFDNPYGVGRLGASGGRP